MKFNKYHYYLCLLLFFAGKLFASPCSGAGISGNLPPKRLKLGYSISISAITQEKMSYAKSAGIDYIEVSLSAFLDKESNFKLTEQEIIEKVTAAKALADAEGIKIWSIHMPFSKLIDLSVADESARLNVVALHRRMLKYAKLLRPEVILFHPSYFLGLNERELRKTQLIKSAITLNKAVREIKAIMVIENMLGPALLVDANRERPLCRSVEETKEIMDRLPSTIYSAIDMNHIKDPENLILAMGKRLRTVHIADGTGKQENHYFPCSGQGQNNWLAILTALNKVGYNGPFMYESAYKDVKDMKPCYESLYQQWLQSL